MRDSEEGRETGIEAGSEDVGKAPEDREAVEDLNEETRRAIRSRLDDGDPDEPDEDGDFGRGFRAGYEEAKRRVLDVLSSNELLERQLEAIRKFFS